MLRFGKNVNAALVAVLIMLVIGTTASANVTNKTSSMSHHQTNAHWVAPPAAEIWPNDPALAQDQLPGAYRDMDLPKAWAVTTCSPSVKTAIIDTGINISPSWDADLVPNQLGTFNGVDGSSDATDKSPEGLQGDSHGTAMAQVGFAVGNNGIGTAGICWHAKYLMAKYVEDWTSWDAITADIYWAVRQGARVINMSIQADGYAPSGVNTAIAYAHDNGVVVVISAGNQGSSDPTVNTLASLSPQAIRVGEYWPGLFGVGDGLSKYSNHGPWVDVAADDTMPFVTSDGIQRAAGTSAPAVVVTGLAAMLLSYRPELNPDQVKKIIMASCVRPLSGRLDVACGGYVNAFKMLIAAGYKPPKQLTLNVTGKSTVRVNGQKVSTKRHVFYFAAGTTVQLKAKAAKGWHFVRWQGVRPIHQQSVNLQVRWTKTVTAVFAKNPKK
jgi:hypothetical protein